MIMYSLNVVYFNLSKCLTIKHFLVRENILISVFIFSRENI